MKKCDGFSRRCIAVQRCEQDLNVPQFALLLANVINTTRTISFVNNFGSVGVFVFVVKEAFDLPCLPQDYKDEIEISEFVKFCNKSFTEFFVSAAKRELALKLSEKKQMQR